jgi:hypothetical protein
MDILLDAVNVILFVAVSVVLVGLYRESRRVGYPWLGVPLVVLPFLSLPISRWIRGSADALVSGGAADVVFPFTLVAGGDISLGDLLVLWNGVSHLIWSAFVLLGLLLLRRGAHRVGNR